MAKFKVNTEVLKTLEQTQPGSQLNNLVFDALRNYLFDGTSSSESKGTLFLREMNVLEEMPVTDKQVQLNS